jgi:hypothetical protein
VGEDGRAPEGKRKGNKESEERSNRMIETETTRKRKAKDRDGIYKRRGHWHFEYKDSQTGQWRSKTTGKTNY